jgi:transcriptional regulator with XRE-family HTH domain
MSTEGLEKKLSSDSLAPMSFPARVKWAMNARGLKMDELEQLMGRSKGYLSRTLSEARDPRLSSVVAFAEALKVRVEWLATGKGAVDPEGGGTGETMGMLEGWAEAAAEAAKHPRWKSLGYAIAAAAERPVFVRPPAVTVEFVLAVARFWLDHAAQTDIEAAEVAEAERRTARSRDGSSG